MALSDHITLSISQDNVGVAKAGFGVPLIVSYNASWVERIRTYTDLASVLAESDFDSDTPEYLAAQAIFAQNPHPTKIAIGRGALPPTQKYQIDVSSVVNSTDYSVTVGGEGFATETVTYTSDASATNDEIAEGLRDAINAITSNNYTATVTGSAGSEVCVVTADAAGGWFSIEVLDTSLLSIAQTHADPGIATDLAALAVASVGSKEWYCLLTNFNSNAMVNAAAAWVESNQRLYLVDVNETEAITTAVGNSDTLDDIATSEYERTAGLYYPSPLEMAAASFAGTRLSKDPGSVTWKFARPSGLPAVTLTSTQRGNLTDRNAGTVESVAGVTIFFDGKVASGNYIDVTRGLDWLKNDMETEVFAALAGADKIPFTDAGVAVIEAAVRGSLKRAVARDLVTDDFVVTVPKVADVSSANKSARNLPDVKFSATLAGAIHTVTITGVVSV